MAEQKMQLVDWFDDLCVRFIINLPQEELESVARICFQVEEAQWFYEDFIRPIDPTLPSLNLKQFCLRIFKHCPLLSDFSDEQHLLAYQEFLGYKTRVPVRGAIMLNQEMDKVVLVKGWKNNASWSFPRGKINKDEKDLDCAVREVYEETGYDINAAGLVPDEEAVKAIDVTMREQHMRLFVFRGVPETTPFEPKTRKEISKISWYRLTDLPTLRKGKQGQQPEGHEHQNPNKFYMVAPFLGPLKKWIHQQKKIDARNALQGEYTGDEMQSEAYAEEQATQLPQISHVSNPHATMLDPAAELKRFLSVPGLQHRPPLQQPQPVMNQQQDNPLLAMLRGSGSNLPAFDQSRLPHTPLDQIGGFPPEPETPDVRHAKHSPYVREQPPPQFSPHHLQPQMASMNLQAVPTPRPGAFDGAGRQQFPTGKVPDFLQQSQTRPLEHHDQFTTHQSQAPSQFGRQGPALKSGPLPPPPSHLPAPRLNNHALSLLDAFRSGSKGPHPPPNDALRERAGQGLAAASDQQRSLLDLFKAPTPNQTAQSSTSAMTTQKVQVTTAAATTTSTKADQPSRPTNGTARKTSAVNMITRTLPKVKKTPAPPAPVIDNQNYPVLGSQPAPRVNPAEHVPKEPTSVQQPMKILSRPVTTVDVSSTTARSNSRPASRGKHVQVTSSPKMTILQRPLENPPAVPHPRQDSQPQGAFKPQILKRGEPQANSPVEMSASTEIPKANLEEPAKTQRDTLLSLFAQSRQTVASPPLQTPAEANRRIPSPRHPGQPGFIPTQVMSRTASQASVHGPIGGERSRVGSTSSPISLGTTGRQPSVAAATSGFGLPSPTHSAILNAQHGDAAGTRAPGTPIEAKGFLMDYLDGVVRGGK